MDNTLALYNFLNIEEGLDIMIGTSDGTVKYLVTILGDPFYATDFYLNGLFDYSICAKFKEKFYEINMMQEDESLVKMDHKNGFTHILKTKS